MDPRGLLRLGVVLLLATPLQAQLSFDNFDTYAAGSTIAGQGDWQTWDLNPAVDAVVSNAFANSAPNSLELQPFDDIVRLFNGINSGQFVFTSQVYIPSGQNGVYYFILLNTYNVGGPYNWSAQIQISDLTGLVTDVGGSQAVTGIAGSVPIIYDAWVEVRVEVDLTTDTYDAFYDNLPIMTGNTWTGGIGASQLQCLDLYNDGGGTFYYDDVSVDCLGGCGGCNPFDAMTCDVDCLTNNVDLSWSTFQVGGYANGIQVFRNGTLLASLPGTATTYTDISAPLVPNDYTVVGDCGAQTWSAACSSDPAACIESGNCSDGIDNDLDGDVDCFDSDCAADAVCLEAGNCADGIDNDLDGDIDCFDVDCATDIVCLPVASNDECIGATPVGEGTFPWDNGVTTQAPVDGPNDCDLQMTGDVWFEYTPSLNGFATIGGCGALGSLADTTLIVYDAALGCPTAGSPCIASDDDTCANGSAGPNFMSEVTIPVIAGNAYYVQIGGWLGSIGDSELIISIVAAETDCFDGIDDDGDTLVDCADPDCAPTCDESLNCTDGIDNDADGDIDCADIDCAANVFCDESVNCADGIDNDLDGNIDCADSPDCDFDPNCVPISTNDDPLTALGVNEGVFTFNNSGTLIDGPNDCDANMTTDVWYLYTATQTANARIETCGGLGSLQDTTLIVYDGALGPPVPGSAFLACDDDTCANGSGGPNFMSTVTIPVVAGSTYYVQAGGWNGTTGTGQLTISLEVSPATGVTCVDTGTSVDASWTPSTGGPGQDSQNIYVDGVLVAAGEPMTTTSWSAPYAAGFSGLVEICVETVFGSSTSDLACCSFGVGGPSNDNCANATPLTLGTPESGTLTLATNDGTSLCGASAANPDVWYSFTAPNDGTYLFATCGSNALSGIDTTITLFDVCGGIEIGCDDDHGGLCVPSTSGLDSAFELAMLAGETVQVRVSHFGTASIGGGDFTVFVEQDCGDIGLATCTYDSIGDTVTINWTNNANAGTGYEIFENGVSVGTAPAGSSSFVVAGPPAGFNTYDVTWVCDLSGVAGTQGTCTVNIVAPIPAGTTDVILNKDAADGDTGLYDSGAALSASLATAGFSPFTVAANDFDTLSLDFTGVSRVWVCTGSFPSDDRLSAAEGDLLASLNDVDSIGVYFEGGDHWGFLPVASGLDARDGVSVALDGGDTFTDMVAVANGGVSDQSTAFPGVTAYTQNQAGNDWTDELTFDTSDTAVDTAETLWEDGDEPGVFTSGYTEHTTGAPMIVQSWMIGGFGGDLDTLVANYAALLGGGPPPPTDPDFVRGDANADGTTNIADAIFILGVLFPTGTPPTPQCSKALDTNDDGGQNIADAISLLGVLFPNTTPAPTMPAPTSCGQDPTPDSLTCDGFAPCP